MLCPNKGVNILGTTTEVNPLYAINSGKVATVGTISLYLHLRSMTSSMKPNNDTKHIDKSAALYSTNLNKK
jgi:hypothetical protein